MKDQKKEPKRRPRAKSSSKKKKQSAQPSLPVKEAFPSKVNGVLHVHSRGFGFLKPEQKNLPFKEVFIPKNYTHGAVDGDFVEVDVNEIWTSQKGPEGVVSRILKRGRTHVTGVITHLFSDQKGQAFVSTLGKQQSLKVIKSKTPLQVGDRVVIHVTKWGSPIHEATGEVIDKMGHISDPSCDIQAAIEEFDLDDDFPEKALKEAEAFGNAITLKKGDKREDFRNIMTFTIDPKTAKDFDDALSLTLDNHGHYHLGVHIADVSAYVKPGTALDEEAKKRSNSVYFPGRVLPMLPENLSNNLCSLKPKVNRFTVSVLMEFSEEGELLNSRITKSIIKSQKRFTYEEAKEILDGKKQSPFAENLKLMETLCLILKKKRYERGSIEFAFPDIVVEVDKEGSPKDLHLIQYDISHQLVEEFMLKANETVATRLAKEGKPLTYRIHEEPHSENLREFASLATHFGFKLSLTPTSEELQQFFDEVRQSPFGQFLATAFIKSMKLATYSCDNVGHYGLQLDYYTHFTSPIRRYIDLVVHRLLFDEVKDNDLEKVALTCSEKERISAKAANGVVLLKKLRLLQTTLKKNPQAKFQAMITQVKNFGLFFEVTDFLLEGFIHISEIGDDYYIFYPDQRLLEGRHDSQQFIAGEPICVKPLSIDLTLSEVQWKLVHEKNSSSSKKHSRNKKKHKKHR